MPFQIFIGGRGIGKTYSATRELALRECDDSKKFMFMRRTDSEIERLITKYTHPFKIINQNEGLEIDAEYFAKERYGIFYDAQKDVEDRSVIGYAAALSTFAKMRGIDYSDVDTILFDEFIPEKHVHRMAAEGEAFLHMYETVNRNREFEGRDPVRVYMLANSINLNNDILLGLGVVSIIADMKVKGRSRFTDKKRGIYIELMENAEFKGKKAETALYRLTGGTEFSEQALNNAFTDDNFQAIEKVPLIEYKPMFSFGVYTIYTHKSTGELYICKKKASGVIRYQECDKDIMYWRFAPMYRQLVLARMVKYDDYATKLVFDAVTKRP